MQSDEHLVEGGGFFDTERRGYARHQVDQHVWEMQLRERDQSSEIRRLERELHLAVRQRDWEHHVAEERRREIDVLQEGMTRLTTQVKELEESPTGNATLGMRIQRMLSLAEDEARSKIDEAEKAAEDIMARAMDKSHELMNEAQDRSTESKSELKTTREECTKIMDEAREKASNIVAEAEMFKRKVESHAVVVREEMSAALEAEIEEKKRGMEILFREQEDEALRAAEAIVAQARVEAAAKIRESQSAVATCRREYLELRASEGALLRKMEALKESLEVLLRTCGGNRSIPALPAGFGADRNGTVAMEIGT